MDESWRMRMGLNNLPRRRSTEESSSDRMMRRSGFGIINSKNSDSQSKLLLDPENFNDVFGGPPRSVVSRQFSADLTNAGNKSNNSTTYYEEIFRSSEFVAQQAKNNSSGKKLPGFKISGRISGGGGGGFRRSDGFYDDIFGSDNEDRRSWRSESKSNKLNYTESKSKSKSKSNSSSVLSSEDSSPLRPSIAEDVFFTSFSSKLRPINVPGRRNSSSERVDQEQRKGVTSSDFPWVNAPAPITDHPQFMEYHSTDLINNENYKMRPSSKFGFSHTISSPETISIIPNSYGSCIKIPASDGLDILDSSPSSSSVVSLHRDITYDDDHTKTHYQEKNLQEEEEVMSSSYVIEFNHRDKGMRGEAVGIDEAIAWAKEKFQS